MAFADQRSEARVVETRKGLHLQYPYMRKITFAEIVRASFVLEVKVALADRKRDDI